MAGISFVGAVLFDVRQVSSRSKILRWNWWIWIQHLRQKLLARASRLASSWSLYSSAGVRLWQRPVSCASGGIYKDAVQRVYQVLDLFLGEQGEPRWISGQNDVLYYLLYWLYCMVVKTQRAQICGFTWVERRSPTFFVTRLPSRFPFDPGRCPQKGGTTSSMPRPMASSALKPIWPRKMRMSSFSGRVGRSSSTDHPGPKRTRGSRGSPVSWIAITTKKLTWPSSKLT